jgi:hypothetical protein
VMKDPEGLPGSTDERLLLPPAFLPKLPPKLISGRTTSSAELNLFLPCLLLSEKLPLLSVAKGEAESPSTGMELKELFLESEGVVDPGPGVVISPDDSLDALKLLLLLRTVGLSTPSPVMRLNSGTKTSS